VTISPTQLSLRLLRDDGWLVDVCERWVPNGSLGGSRKDLFGLLDLVALKDDTTMGVQTTSHTNVNARLNKIQDEEHQVALRALQAAGWSIVVHGWRLSSRDGHACKHGKVRCGCRWTLHRLINIEPLTVPDPNAEQLTLF
jgi:hypothetical protein